MKIKLKNNSGFTLIELLMVISIITLISSIFFSYVGSVRAKSRDAVRLSDMKQINTAAKLYYEDKGMLPDSIGGTTNSLVSAGYLSAEPKDPKTGNSYGFRKVNNSVVIGGTYETQFRLIDDNPQQVGVVIGDISVTELCNSNQGNTLFPNCTEGDSNDQIIGVTNGHRRSGGSGDYQKPPAPTMKWSAINRGPVSWFDGKIACDDSTEGSYEDWRLPTLEEFKTKYDETGSTPVGFLSGDHDYYWSIKEYEPYNAFAWMVNLRSSDFIFASHKSIPYYVRCIR